MLLCLNVKLIFDIGELTEILNHDTFFHGTKINCQLINSVSFCLVKAKGMECGKWIGYWVFLIGDNYVDFVYFIG